MYRVQKYLEERLRNRDSGTVEQYLSQFQGIFLAILYCFCNSEVQDTIKRAVRRCITRSEVRRSTTINSSRVLRNSSHGGGGGGNDNRKSVTTLNTSVNAVGFAAYKSNGTSTVRTGQGRAKDTAAFESNEMQALTADVGGSSGGSSAPPKPPRLHHAAAATANGSPPKTAV